MNSVITFRHTVAHFTAHDVRDMEIKESSGLSQVYIHPACAYAFQYFYNRRKAHDIFLLYGKLRRYSATTMIEVGDVNFIYNVRDHIAMLEVYVPNGTIVWWKHTCLSEFNPPALCYFLEINLYKLLYDITKALICMDRAGLLHRDCTIDNIGIRRGRFILFDFDAMVTMESYIHDGGMTVMDGNEIDVDRFIRSVNFRTNDTLRSQIPSVSDSDTFFKKLIGMYQKRYMPGAKLSDVVITLESLPIKWQAEHEDQEQTLPHSAPLVTA